MTDLLERLNHVMERCEKIRKDADCDRNNLIPVIGRELADLANQVSYLTAIIIKHLETGER